MPRRVWVGIAIVTAIAYGPSSAPASPIDIIGFGAEHAGRAGAVSASVDDFAAAYYNPAGLAFGRRKRLTFGFTGFVSNLRANNERMPIDEPIGLVVGATSPAPLGGPLENRLHVGIGLHLLPTNLVRIRARLPDEPFFPYYDSRAQRLVVLPVISVRATETLAIGIGINFLGTLGGTVQAAEGPMRSLDPRLDEEVPPVAKINAGIRWRAHPKLDLALVYRQRFEIPFFTIADTTVAGEPIDLNVEASAQFTPNTIVVGSAFRPRPTAELTLDVAWANWSEFPGPFVTVESQLPLLEPFAGELPTVPYKDTVTVRAGGQVDASDALTLRGGVAFETSPIPADQPGVTNLLDGPKSTLALGASFRVRDRVRIDVHAAAQYVAPRELDKRIAAEDEDADLFDALRDEDDSTPGAQTSNVGWPSIDSTGQVFSGGVTMEVGF